MQEFHRMLMRGVLLALGIALLGGCAAWQPFDNAPPSSARPWNAPDMPAYSAALSKSEHDPVSVNPQKIYELPELIDLAQRNNPETRVAWERARQAAIAIGLAEGTYYPALAAAATGAVAHVPTPIPTTVVPGGVFTADTHFVIPALSLEWLLLDFGRRRALTDAARALTMEAIAGFNAKHQQIVFEVTREFHALTAVRGRVAAGRASLTAARSLEDAATGRKEHGLATLPEVLQAQEETARATYDLEDAVAAEHDARLGLLETIGIRPGTPIEIADASQLPLPPALAESVDEAIDRALAQRPDLIARLASVRAKEAEVRKSHADYWPRLVARAAVGGNIGELKVEDSAYQGVHELQYDAGFRFEWALFEGFERRNKLRLAESMQQEAEDELEHAKDKAVREVWKAYDDTKVALAKHRAAVALLAASDKAWTATLESYQRGLATFPDVRESERNLARARTLDQAARAEVLTRAAAFAFSTGDLARPDQDGASR
jgi:outer membrane protein TolC